MIVDIENRIISDDEFNIESLGDIEISKLDEETPQEEPVDNFYARNFTHLPLLTPAEEAKYTKDLKTGTPSEKKIAADELISHNMRYVLKLAGKYIGYGLSFDDIVQCGAMGLMKAVQKFDYTLGYRFTTYATYWIRQSIRRNINATGRTVYLPNYLYEEDSRIKKAEENLIDENLSNSEKREKIAKATGIAPERIDYIKATVTPISSLDKPLQNDESGSAGTALDFVKDESRSIEEEYEVKWIREPLHKCMKEKLTPREYDILCRRFGLLDDTPRTLETIAIADGITRERVRQIEAKALKKLKNSRFSALFKEYAS